MERKGAGDRWLSGQAVPGVAFAQRAPVEIVGGARDGQRGTVLLLVALDPEPAYLVLLETGGDVRIRQSNLRAAD